MRLKYILVFVLVVGLFVFLCINIVKIYSYNETIYDIIERSPAVWESIHQGDVLASQSKFKDAELQYRQALNMIARFTKTDESVCFRELSSILKGLGDIDYSQGNLSKACDNYRKALGVRRRGLARIAPGTKDGDDSVNIYLLEKLGWVSGG
jgi:hypothetical protein